jgi:hypothetical protein
MYTDKDKEMVIKYLQRHYPVRRVRINNKFKRAILLNNGEAHQLNNKANYDFLKTYLIKTLILVFSFDEAFCRNIVNNFLPL